MKKSKIKRINDFINQLDDAILTEEQNSFAIGGVVSNDGCTLNVKSCTINMLTCTTNKECTTNIDCTTNKDTCATNLKCIKNPTCIYINSTKCTNDAALCA